MPPVTYRLVEERLRRLRIVSDQVVEIFDLIAQRVIDRLLIKFAGVSNGLEHRIRTRVPEFTFSRRDDYVQQRSEICGGAQPELR
jgi:hypothetical protein